MWAAAVAMVAMSAAQYAMQAKRERDQADVAMMGAEMERMQYEHEQKQAQLDAKKDEARRLEDLRAIEGSNEAAMGASGLSGGASFNAIRTRNKNIAIGDVKDRRLLGASRAFKFGIGASSKKIEAASHKEFKQGAIGRALLGFGTDMASMAATGGFSSMGGPKKA